MELIQNMMENTGLYPLQLLDWREANEKTDEVWRGEGDGRDE
jgi:hypothetical protein